jgi:hypothetical protein
LLYLQLFTTFFKHEIESKVPNASTILGLYGYQEKTKNIVELKESVDLHKIVNTSFELFLSTIEFKVLFDIGRKAKEYTDDFTLIDILKARVKSKGDVDEAMTYFLKDKGGSISKVKRIKLDESEGDRYQKSNKLAAESDDASRVYSGNVKTDKSKRDTKYPPITQGYGNGSSVAKTRVMYISSSTANDLSDAELYGYPSPSNQSTDNYMPMEFQETGLLNGRKYDHTQYGIVGVDENGYEVMGRQSEFNQPSLVSLPPPLNYLPYNQGVPPPSYSEATHIPGNDWVMIPNHDSRADKPEHSRPNPSADDLNKTIPGFSAMNIGGNGISHDIRKTSSGVNGDYLSKASPDVRIRGVNGIDPQRIGYLKETAHDIPREEPREPIYDVPRKDRSNHEAVPQGVTTRERSYSSSALKEPFGDAKRVEDKFSNPTIKKVFDEDHRDRSPTSAIRALDKSLLSHQKDVGKSSSLQYGEKAGDSYKSKADLGRSASFGLRKTSKSKDQYQSHLTEKGSQDPMFKDVCDTYDVPKTTVLYSTPPLYPKETVTVNTVTTRSQSREIAKKQMESEVLHEPLQSTSKTTDGYSKDTCILCNNKATHYCQVCKKLCCKDCIGRVIILSCVGYTEHHRIVEGHPTLGNQEKHLSSNEQGHNVCSFCGGIPSHKCIYCSKHSCGTCFSRYKTDPCSSGFTGGHHFVNQQSQKVTREKDEMATSEEPTTPIVMDNHPHINEQNICDFCGLAATLLCKSCLKPICNTCRYVYKQDLCPPTKKEHQFENIVAQPSKIDETAAKGSDTPWECERCTFVNSANHRICSVCATSRGVNQVEFPTSGSRKCAHCTYGNEEGATICKMCSCSFGLDKPESYI